MDMNWNEQEQKQIKLMLNLLAEAQQYVQCIKPNAHILYTFNKQGEKTHFGLYDCLLGINEKGNFRREQPAPQLLGDLIPYDRYKAKEISMLLHVGAWTSARIDLGKLNTSLNSFALLRDSKT